MPPWIAAAMVVASVGVFIFVYNHLSSGPQQEEGHCSSSSGCSYHDRSPPRKQSATNGERYDTPPDCRQRRKYEEDCPICLEPIYIAPQHTLRCNHKLHYDCYVKFRPQSDLCPICRRAL